ncbi:MAG: RraA family protein [Nocardioidaceae bacterium]
MDGSVRCIFPGLGPVAGYAATATIRASDTAEGGATANQLWEHVRDVPGPRVVVVQDLDNPPGIGSLWGEVNSNVFRALGAVGTVTNGCVRDLQEMEALGFHAFAGCVGVSHAYVHVLDVGIPVDVGGLTVRPGDLLHADRHGVLNVPLEVAPELAEAIRQVEVSEREIIDLCQSPEFSVDALAAAFRRKAETESH